MNQADRADRARAMARFDGAMAWAAAAWAIYCMTSAIIAVFTHHLVAALLSLAGAVFLTVWSERCRRARDEWRRIHTMSTDPGQRWHDTDHGADREPPSRDTRFRTPVAEEEAPLVSSCWCCCQLCDPDWNPDRPNPYWTTP